MAKYILKLIFVVFAAFPQISYSAQIRAKPTSVSITSRTTAGDVTTTFSPLSISASILPNPEKGWDSWSGNDFVSSYDSASVTSGYNSGNRLLSCLVSLSAFRTSSISTTFLSNLDASFSKVRSAGMKCVVWFYYDFSANGNDATADQIVAHTIQLKPILQSNVDVIAYVKAGFVGAWGEWHSSKNNNTCYGNSGGTSCAVADPNLLKIKDAILSNFPSNLYVQFRYPKDLIKWYPNVLTSTQAFSPTAQARSGFHNDCFQGGSTDTGTYQNSAQRDYVKSLSEFTPFGGEQAANCDAPHRTSCADILSEGAQYHMTWLKGTSANIAEWTNAWQAGGCYNEVINRMGYRFQVDQVNHNSIATRGGSAAINVDLRNLGWSRIFSSRKVVVTLVHSATGAKIVATGTDDLMRALPPQATTSKQISINVPIPSTAAVGDYDVYLSIPDIYPNTSTDVRFNIRFANADNSAKGQLWNASTGQFKVGSLIRVQ